MRAIFISYRREDSEGQAGRLFDDLVRRFGEHTVFMDVAGIEPGRDFRRAIDEHVSSCGVLLALIGKNWVDATDGSGRRRLDDAQDFVRLETASALKRDIPVVPVLVHGAQMPRADQLPPDLAELAYRNGVELTHARWDSDVQVLIKALTPYVEVRPQDTALPGAASTTPTAGTAAAHAVSPPTASPKGVAPSFAPATRSKGALIAIAAAVLIVIVGGYAWSARSGESSVGQATEGPVAAAPAREAPGPKSVAQPPAPTRPDPSTALAAEEGRKRAAAQEAADRVEAQKRTDATNAADKIEAEKRAEARAAADHRARWLSYDFPAPNGGFLVYTIMPDGNPACASYNGGGCLWGMKYDDIDFNKLMPLVCGEGHRARWGVTGYDDPKHWCSLARTVRGSKS